MKGLTMKHLLRSAALVTLLLAGSVQAQTATKSQPPNDSLPMTMEECTAKLNTMHEQLILCGTKLTLEQCQLLDFQIKGHAHRCAVLNTQRITSPVSTDYTGQGRILPMPGTGKGK